jgi:tetratricopeptide (TPR) repeat protein
MGDHPSIFISYRRTDAGGHARALHEYLCGRFGEPQVFFDRSNIESGDEFPETLRQGVEGCALLLALIGPDWLDAKGKDGGRRLDDAHDFVRREIARAFELGKRVIPVLFDDTPVPEARDLPEPLKPLASRAALTLRGKTYEYETQRRELVRLLAAIDRVPEPFPEAGEMIRGIDARELPAIIEAATRGWQQRTAAQEDTIRSLERELGANREQLLAFFRIIGEANVPAEQQAARLVDIAVHYRALKANLAPEAGEAPEVARLKNEARAALDGGRLAEADDMLMKVEEAQDADLARRQAQLARRQADVARRQVERAATAAQRGDLAMMRLRYREAAAHFADAAAGVPPGFEEKALDWLNRELEALCRQGEEFGDNGALGEAIAGYRNLLLRRPRERMPLDWATAQNNLGLALMRLGERESGTETLKKAVAAHEAALTEGTRERVPLDWAATQNNLGGALLILGERENGTETLKKAVAACEAALQVRTRERVPLDWAATQNNLGLALRSLGERESGTETLEKAVAAYEAALEAYRAAGASYYVQTAEGNLQRARALLDERRRGG